jgi:ribonuclease J
VPVEVRHVSGHAYVADLRRLARAIAPERLVPIHTEAPSRYGSLFPRVDVRRDGAWWNV